MEGWALPELPPLITDILLSLDDKCGGCRPWGVPGVPARVPPGLCAPTSSPRVLRRTVAAAAAATLRSPVAHP